MSVKVIRALLLGAEAVTTRVADRIAAGDVALAIVMAEIAELDPDALVDEPVVECGAVVCGRTGTTPATVHVIVTVQIFDTFFGAVDTGRDGWTLTADVTLPYVGT